jgi:Ca2+-binding RTX toxin-like protein
MRVLRWAAAVAAPVLVIGVTAPAWADNIYNNVDGSIDSSVETMSLTAGGSNGTTTLAVQTANGDGKNGCNLNQNNNQTLDVSVSSSNTAAATVTPSTIHFTSCGQTQVLTVHPVGAGSTSVTLSETSNNTGATFNLATAAFDVNVAAPNTPPTVTVSGVTNGGSYDKGSVPTAMCDVTDAEDGPSSFAATLSSVTGTYASDDIGSQTADCSYTDGGGATDTDSATYGIGDPSAPDVQFGLTPASPNGANGWYNTGVDVDWTVTDTDSPNSLSTTDCDDFSLTADQVGTDYTCMADSAGGHQQASTGSIAIDGTKPTIDSVDGGPTDGATYYFGLETVPAAPTCSASDATSGVNGDGCVITGWSDQLGSQTVTATATDNAGNVETQSPISYDVVECNGDTSAVGTVCAPKCNGELATIKGDNSGPILGTLGDDVIVGTLGNDTIDGLGGDDTICGLDGVDQIDGSEGNDVIIGGTGEDIVNGGDGNDIIRGGTDDDTLNGDPGTDVLKGEGGADVLNGGDDNDNLQGLIGNDTLNGDAGDDLLSGASGADELNGGDGVDMVIGGVGNDTLNGGEGADTLKGQEGLDAINGDDGDDTVFGGEHADTVHGGAGADTLNGGDGNDSMFGEDGNDTLNGNAGDDSLSGGDGDDRLIGGAGTDALDGGAGINHVLQ